MDEIRLIDANWLKEAFCEWCESSAGSKANNVCGKTCGTLDFFDKLPVVDSANLWIPCDKRMPEKNTEVLAYSPSWGKIVVAIWSGEYWLEQWSDDDFDESEFSHWLPLPDRPIIL